VLFGKRRAYQRKVAVADFDGICSGDIYVLETKDPSVLLPELLPFICQTDGFFEHAIGTSAGSLSPRTNWKSLANYEFALPPLDKQRQLARTLNATLKVADCLDESTNQLEQVIAASMMNLLDRQLSTEQEKQHSIDSLGLYNEPVLKTGPFGSRLKTEYFQQFGRPVITIGSMTNEGLDARQFFFLSESRALEFSEYECNPGDIVFSRVADVGRCHLIEEDECGYIISSNLIRIRASHEIIRPRYLWLLLKYSVSLRKQIGKLTTQAAGRLLVNTKTLALLTFNIPPLMEQDAVVAEFHKIIDAQQQLAVRHKELAVLISSLQALELGSA
jgi:type I restriction enzyme S subunit